MVNRYETEHEWYVICSVWYRLMLFCVFYWPVHLNFHIRCYICSIWIFNAVKIHGKEKRHSGREIHTDRERSLFIRPVFIRANIITCNEIVCWKNR